MVDLFCRVKRRRVLLICIFILFLVVIAWKDSNVVDVTISANENCENGFSEAFLKDLCKNYSLSLADGNLCSSVCEKGTFRQNGCRSHSTTIVIDGWLNGRRIVLKWKNGNWQRDIAKDTLKDILNSKPNAASSPKRQWEELVINKVQNTVVGNVINQDIRNVLKNLKAPDTTNVEAMLSFLSLSGQDEFAMFGVYQDLKHFPTLYGYCGHTYAVQKLIPYDKFFPAIIHKLDWKRTKKVALSFLDMIEELENAKDGPLQHCDIQEGNFGVTDDYDIKLIDVDLLLTKEKAELFLAQPNCTKDADCSFFDCVSMCDVKNKKCLSKQITSNLQILCRDIFKSSWPFTGLFGNMPQHLRPLLSPLILDCASRRFGYFSFKHLKVKSMIRSFRMILSKDNDS